MRKPKVAFICVHNSCRSQIAEALGKKLAADVFESYSAGTETKPQINQDAVRLMKAVHGIDMEREQYSKLLSELPDIDVVVTMGCNVQCPTLPCAHREDWGLDDPTGQPDEVFLDTIRQIEAKILDLKARLAVQGEGMKILCFGDSNTYGYDPRSYFGGQYPAQHRWVDLLAQKLGCKADNAGENGREIPRREGELQRFDLMLSNQKPLDLLLVMLGGNDLLQGNCVEVVAQRMEAFLTRIPLEKSKIVLIGPPRMKPGAWITNDRLLEDCVRLNVAYRTVAESLGVRFVDATDWDIEVTFDGVHYSEKGHQTFAEQLWLALQ